jgi:hypothetical protein
MRLDLTKASIAWSRNCHACATAAGKCGEWNPKVNGTVDAQWGKRGAADLRKWGIGMMTVRMTTRRRGFAIVWLSLAMALVCSKSVPATAEDLYRAQTVVTGQGEANRMIGFASCMENVLIKVSGAQQLNGTSTSRPALPVAASRRHL